MFHCFSNKLSIVFLCSALTASFTNAQHSTLTSKALDQLANIKHQQLNAEEAARSQGIDMSAKSQGRFGLGVGPTRVAVAIPASVDVMTQGTVEHDSQGNILRYRFSSPGAKFLSFNFSNFKLPTSAEVHFISVDHNYSDGPYLSKHNKPQGSFASPMVPGDSAIIEVRMANPDAEIALELGSVSHGYKDLLNISRTALRNGHSKQNGKAKPGSGEDPVRDLSCQRDINCSEGSPYQTIKRASVYLYDGSFQCSGQMLNNTALDNRLLMLSANHCNMWQSPQNIVSYWGFENSSCGSDDAPSFTSTGASLLYNGRRSEMALFELHGTDIDSSFNLYFSGWDATGNRPANGFEISYPLGAPKQIMIDNDAPTDCDIEDCPGSWWNNFWRVTQWEVGHDHEGSSGGGYWDNNQRLIGTVTSGAGDDCPTFEYNDFAKLSYAFDAMKAYLDPVNSGVLVLDGKDNDGGSNNQPPGQPNNPSPANGATNISISSNLNWGAATNASSYDVYFGTTSNNLSFQANQTGTSHAPVNMNYDSSYFWRIDAVNSNGTTTGNTWSFTTESDGTGGCNVYESNNRTHANSGRAYKTGKGKNTQYFATGSDELLPGDGGTVNTLYETQNQYFSLNPCN